MARIDSKVEIVASECKGERSMKDRFPLMKKYEEQDSRENIIKTMVQDSICRDIQLVYFIRFLATKSEENKITVVNGKWGTGKTFFLKQFELMVNYVAGRICDTDEIERCIEFYRENDVDALQRGRVNLFDLFEKECQEFVEEKVPQVLYFNAWEYDEDEDPMRSLMFFIMEKYHYDYTQIDIDWKELGKKALKYLFGIEYGNHIVNKENPFEDIVTNIDIKKMWRMLLNAVTQENCNKLYIIIDDLDRCRPQYVMKMFERLRHFAYCENVEFILGLDYDEVASMVETFYGYKDGGYKFLEKVIDHCIDLESNRYKYFEKYLGNCVQGKCCKKEYANIPDIITKVKHYMFADYSFTFREIARFNEIIEYISFFYDEYAVRSGGDLGNGIIKGIFMPYLLGLKIKDRRKYNSFVEGDGIEEFLVFLDSHSDLLQYLRIKGKLLECNMTEIYEFIVKIMKSDIDTMETRDIDDIRVYDNSIRHALSCINLMYDFELNSE